MPSTHSIERQSPVGEAPGRSVGSFLTDVFSRLEKSGVSYCVLRNYEGLPDHVGNDVDLLVLPRDAGMLQHHLYEASRSYGWRLIRRMQRFGFKSYWFVHGMSGEALHIDAWSRLDWKGLLWADSADICRRRVKRGLFYVADEVSEAAILLLKDILQNGTIREKYFTRIQSVAVKHPDDLKASLRNATGEQLADRMVHMVSAGQWDRILSARAVIRRAVLWHNLLPNPLRAPAGVLGFLRGHIRTAFGSPGGMFVALVGPDGSGKSTVAAKLAEQATHLFTGHRYYHGRFGMLPRLAALKAVLSGRAKETDSSDIAQPAGSDVPPTPHGRLRTFVYIAYYGLDYLFGHLPVQRHRSLGHLIVCDRYFYDWFVQPYMEKTPRALFPLLMRLFPRPDLVVYLCNTPETVHRRKGELSIAEIALQEGRFRELLKHLPDSVVVRTDVSADAVVSQIMNEMTKKMIGEAERMDPAHRPNPACNGAAA